MDKSKDHCNDQESSPTQSHPSGTPSSEQDPDLESCQEEVRRLEEENEELRASSHAFGDLAERLNKSLERRRGLERRAVTRPGPDRRRNGTS